MVVKAFRGSAPTIAAPAAVVEPAQALAQVQSDAATPEYSLIGAAAFFDDSSTVAPSFERESPDLTRFDVHDDSKFHFFEDEDPDYTMHKPNPVVPGAAQNGSSLHREESLKRFDGPIVNAQPRQELQYAEPEVAYLVGAPSVIAEPEVAPTRSIPIEDRIVESPSIAQEVVADPWEAPLPTWDYSQSEWPVLVTPRKRPSFTGLRIAIVAILLFGVASAFYFLIYRPSSPARLATDTGIPTRVSAAAEPLASVDAAVESELRKQASVPDGPTAAASQSAVSYDNSNAQGRFSLQAAAFPTEGGADEFAERLKRSGVPSYVVSADVARRGRWFRVRVGRFNTAEEAQRFAGEAQLRARTAGLALQLIVCPYEQP